jgi:hypothetical protein
MASLLSGVTAAIPGMQSLPGIPGSSVAAPVPAATSAAAPVATAQAPLQPSQMTPFQQFAAGGMRMEKFTLILLTLFPPTGLAGLNLQALQNTAGTLLKVGSYLVSTLWAIRLMSIYPGVLTSLLGAALFLGPWFIFDCMEILMNPDFEKQGFRSPLPIPGYPPPKPTDGSWLLTPTLVSIILALLPSYALGATGIVNQFFPGAVSGDTQKYMGYAVGGTAVLGAAFSMFSANKAPVAPIGGTAVPQLGGSRRAELPPLSSFAKGLMRSTSPEAFEESKVFLGLLGVIVTGGIALSMARNAAASAAAATPMA